MNEGDYKIYKERRVEEGAKLIAGVVKIKNGTFFQLQQMKNKRSAKETAWPLRDNKDNLLTEEIHFAGKY